MSIRDNYDSHANLRCPSCDSHMLSAWMKFCPMCGYYFKSPVEHSSGCNHWKEEVSERKCNCDGYHTFDELYEHRIVLFIALCKTLYNDPQYQEGQKADIWRSKLHSDGTSFDGWFVLGIGKERGEQITYHLPISKWEDTNFAETREKAPEFDGHTSDDVLKRLKTL